MDARNRNGMTDAITKEYSWVSVLLSRMHSVGYGRLYRRVIELDRRFWYMDVGNKPNDN